MTAVLARSPLESLPMAANRPSTRRRSARTTFEEEDAPAPKRPKTEVNGTGKRANGAIKKAAKTGESGTLPTAIAGLGNGCDMRNRAFAPQLRISRADAAIAYDENDDGFQFTRRTTRRTAKAQPQPEAIPEEPSKVESTRRRKPSVAAPEPEPSTTHRRRRSARLSGDKGELDIVGGPSEPANQLPKHSKKGSSIEKRAHKRVTPVPELRPEEKNTFAGVQTPRQNELHVPKKRDGATKIMLPFADTPVINRNKEMRKASKDGHRRSSTGLRGRRASSLIDSGLSNGE